MKRKIQFIQAIDLLPKSLNVDLGRVSSFFNEDEYKISISDGKETLIKIVKKAIFENVDTIAVIGNDTHYFEVAQFIVNTEIRLAFIPLVSGNAIASYYEIPKRFSAALKVIQENCTRSIDTFIVENEIFGRKIGFGSIGVGISGKAINDFHHLRSTKNKKYLVNILFRKFSKVKFSLKFDYFHESIEAYEFAIWNTNKYGNNVTMLTNSRPDDGLLDISTFKGRPNYLMYWDTLMLSLKLRKKTSVPVVYHQTDYAEMYFPQKTKIHIDFTPFQAEGELKVKVNFKSLNLIVPKHTLMPEVEDKTFTSS